MTCNNVILAQPQAEASISYTIPQGDSARLNFGPEDISGLHLGDNGQLIISFADGGQLTITNFQELVDSGSLLYLADGTLVDPAVLTSALQAPDVLGSPEIMDVADVKTVLQPVENTKQEIDLAEGDKFLCEFDPTQTSLVEIIDGNMILTFVDGSQIIFNNYTEMMAGDLPPELTLADGTVIDVDGLLTDVLDIENLGEEVADVEPAAGDEEGGEEDMAALAQQLAEVQPAAGEASGGASNSGYGFNSSPVDVILSSPDAVGPLDPTALQYNAPQFSPEAMLLQADDRPIISPSVESLDETNLVNGNIVVTGSLSVNYGNDTPGTIHVNGTTSVSGSLTNGVLSSGGVPVTINTTPNGYEGVANGVTVFTFEITTGGAYTFTQILPLDHGDTSDDNDVISINFGVIATDADGDRTPSIVRVQIADDAPVILSQIDQTTDETDFTPSGLVVNGQFHADVGQDLLNNEYSANGNFVASGSLQNNVLSSGGVPITVTNTGDTYTGTAGGVTVFVLTLNTDTGEYTYEQYLPLDHGNTNDPNDLMTLQFGVEVVDFDGDTADGFITVNVLDDGPSLDAQTENTTLTDHGDIGTNAGITVVDVTLSPTDVSTSETLTSNGVPVVITLVGNTYTGTANGQTVFDIEINDDGSYTFTQYDELDQGDTTTPVTINIDVSVEDDTGNITTQPIVISVDNDFPDLSSHAAVVSESPLASGSITLSSVIDFGGDGPGAADPTGEFIFSGSVTNWELTSNGQAVTVTLNGNTYVGMAGGVEVFHLEINPATGDYTFVLNQPLDHADGMDPNDLIELQFGMLVSDSEGDSVNGFISIFVEDGVPSLSGDTASIDEDDLSLGPIVEVGTLDHNFGADGEGAVTPSGNFAATGSVDNGVLSHNGTAITVTATANGYVGVAGGVTVFTLDINPLTGQYTFTQFESLDHADNNDANDVITLTFGAEITDFDGDSDFADIVINIADSAVEFQPNGPRPDSGLETVDETDFSGGPIVETGSLNADFGADGPGTYQGIASQVPTGLVHLGVPVTVTFDVNTNSFTGMAGSTAVFTLVIDSATGDYTYTQLATLDHPDGTNHDDVLTLEFGVNAFDNEGEGVAGSIVINVRDDGPDAVNDSASVREEHTITGNVVTNDDAGADGLDVVVNVHGPNGLVQVPATGTVDIVGNYGTLTIAADGSYSYTPNNNDPDGIDNFTYLIRDNDGDLDEATLSIDVSPDYDPIVLGASNTIDETDVDSMGFPNLFGSLNVDFRGEGPGTVTGNGNFTFNGTTALTSGGHPVTVSLTPKGYYLGEANGQTVFYIEISDSGHYNFTLMQPLDHPNAGSANEAINLQFGVVATDVDGDATDGTLTITVRDDGPLVSNSSVSVDESNANQTAHGHVNFDAGFDGGTIDVNKNGVEFRDGNGNALNLGITVVQINNHEFTGVNAQNVAIFRLTIDPQTGDYTYTQLQPFDHPNSNNPNDVITVSFDTVVTDGDGDTRTGEINVNVYDDGPVAHNDASSMTRHQTQATGNVLANDDFGADGAANHAISYIEWDGGDVRAVGVPHPDGSFTVHGNYGTLILQANGAYTYTRSGRSGGVDTFHYTIVDGDGDRSQATLTVNVGADHDPINITGSGATDDTALAGGPDVETGTISVNYQGDGPGTTTGNGNFSAGGSLLGGNLTHNGVAVNVTYNAGNHTYTGSAGGTTVFTMVINANGTYTFRQFENLDHGNTSNSNEALTLTFGVTATDSDGDAGNGTVVITVRDDGPDARNDSASVNGTRDVWGGGFAGSATASGNVLSNDIIGQDNGNLVSVTSAGTYTGNFGVLTINANGSYTYTRTNFNGGGVDRFNYTMRDQDGDTDTAQLSINVSPPPPPPPPPIWRGGDGDGGGDGGDGGDGGGSPLVLDLDGDGVEVTSINDGVRFDMGSDGDLDLVAWVGADDGLLARDANHDGVINDQSELFGTLEEDGFHVLSEYDSNNDGVINADDEVFDELVVWQDVNQDGVTQDGELRTLSELGIQSINLAATMTDYDLEGSWVAYDSTFTYTDGTTGQISDVWFQYIDEGNWNRVVEAMGEDAAREWLSQSHANVSQFIPSETNDDWQPGDPLVLGSTHKVFEIGLHDSIVSQDGELTVFYGGDQPGTITGNGSFQVGGSLLNGALTSHGNAITVTYDEQTGIYFGSTADSIVFNLQVKSDGSYTFNLFESIDHANNVNLDDNILLQFGVTVTDADGDSTDSAIRLQIRDAGSYLSGDVDGNTDNDNFDSTLFQAIHESTDVIASMGDGQDHDFSADISLLLETGDDVSSTIQDFVYSQQGEDLLQDTNVEGQTDTTITAVDNGLLEDQNILTDGGTVI